MFNFSQWHSNCSINIRVVIIAVFCYCWIENGMTSFSNFLSLEYDVTFSSIVMENFDESGNEKICIILGKSVSFFSHLMSCVCTKLLQLCSTLCDPMDYSPSPHPGLFCPWVFSRQKYWSGVPCPPSGDLPNSGIELTSPEYPALAGGFFTTSGSWEALPLNVNNVKKFPGRWTFHLTFIHPATFVFFCIISCSIILAIIE